MSDPVVQMVDTVHASVGLDLAASPYVAGYVSGTADIKWTSGDWSLFGKNKKVRIWQGYGSYPGVGMYDVIDVESGAVGVTAAVTEILGREQAGIQWTTVYGTASTIAAVAHALQAYGRKAWNGHVNCWLANWNLNHDQAAKIIGTMIDGMTCVAVQWASPSSNPNTVLPGSGKTLREANVDLSVVDGTWVPSGGWGAPVVAPKPPPVPPQAVKAVQLAVKYSDGSVKTVAL